MNGNKVRHKNKHDVHKSSSKKANNTAPRQYESDIDGQKNKKPGPRPNSAKAAGFMPWGKMGSIKTILDVYKKTYPHLYKVAADEIKKALFKQTGLSLDPDKHYFYRFTSAENDPASVTGWRHDSARPIEATTLTECVLNNFSADARDNLDVVDQMTGIYNVSASLTESFGSENQLPIKPSVVANIIIEMDFFNLYINKLNKYWQTDIPQYVYLAQFLSALSRLTRSNEKYTDLFLQAFNIIPHKKIVIKKYLFDINGYTATDIIVLAIESSLHYVLYIPGEPKSIFHFHSLKEMKTWFITNCRKKKNRDIMASHFSIYNRQNGNFYDGIDSWLEMFGEADGAKKYLDNIWRKRIEIKDDLIRFIVMQQKNRALSDADSLIKSNAEVRRDMAIKYFSIMNMFLPNPVTPFVSLGLDIDKMVNGDDEPERKEAQNLVLDDCVNVALIALGGLLEGRFSIVYNEGAEFRLENIPVSEQVKKEMVNIRSTGRLTSGEVFTFKGRTLNPPGGKINHEITFHQTMLTKIAHSNIKEMDISLSELSAPNRFGILHDALGSHYIKVGSKIYQVRPTGHSGYYFIGKKNEFGIWFNKRSKQYRMINLKKWRPSAPYTCKVVRSIRTWGNRLCLPQFSPQVRRILAKHLEANPLYDNREPNILYDKDGELFIDRANNQKFILFSNSFFPVREMGNGFVIFKPGMHWRQVKLARVFFSIEQRQSYIVTRMERIGEMFSQAFSEPKLLKMRVNQPLNVYEKQALADYQYKNMQQVNDALHQRMSIRHRSAVIDSDIFRQIENIHSALAKVKPAQCTIFKYGRMKKSDFLKLKPNDLFMNENFVLAGLDKPLGLNISSFWEAEDIPVKFSVQLKNRGYPINFYAADVSDIAILVKDKTFFRTADIKGLRVNLKEITSYEVNKYTSSLNNIRRLNFDIPNEGIDCLKSEVQLIQGLLKKKYSTFNNSPEYIEKYSNLLCSLAEKQINSPALEEYTESGSDFINDWLRFGTRSINEETLHADEEAAELLSDYENMHDFDSYAFRTVEYPAGVYGQSVREGDIVIDKGFMSASALPGNCIGWKESWTKQFSKTKGDQIIIIFDKNVPKKIAGTGFLIDHILIKPMTALKVVSITPADDIKGNPVYIVGVSRAQSAPSAKDIFTGRKMT